VTAPASVLSVGALLGEGPVWVQRDACLWFVDIKGELVHRFDPLSGSARSWSAPAPVGWILPAVGGGYLAGLKTGVHRFDPTSGAFDLLSDPEPDRPGNRLNDAAIDATGRLWFGTMDDDEKHATGRVYTLDAGSCADVELEPVIITNGPAIAPNARTLYAVDTIGRTVLKAAIRDDGTLGPAEPLIRIEDGAGYPDGAVCDAEGCLWIGLFGGWGVRRYDPSGRLMRTIPFPVANVTKIAFGGEGLRTAYATTARKGLDPASLAAQPLAGDLFAFDPDVAGLPVAEAIV
jgi:sugar lactone lactonase YvrE